MNRTFHYALIAEVNDWLALGWFPHASLAGNHHGNWSVLVEWICPCKMVRPS